MFRLFASVCAVFLMMLAAGTEVQANQATGMIQGNYAGLVPIPDSDDAESEWDKICIELKATGDTASVKLVVYSDDGREEMFAASLPLTKNPNEANNPNTPGSIVHLLQGMFTPIQGSAANYGGEKRLFEGNGWRGYLGITNNMIVQMNNSVAPLPDGVEFSQHGGIRLTEKAQCDSL